MMKTPGVFLLLFGFSPLCFAADKAAIHFIMIENDSHGARRQISVAREQNGEFTLTCNSNYFLNQEPWQLGLFSGPLSADEVRTFDQLMSFVPRTDANASGSFKHDDHYSIRGVPVSVGLVREQIRKFISSLVRKTTWKARDAILVRPKGSQLKIDTYQEAKLISSRTGTPEQLCDKVKDGLCALKYGFILLKKGSN